jgi:branched-subunit amino acid ABC-type transport system permease component
MEEFVGYFIDSLVPGSIYACIGLGVVLIYRGTGVVNFGHGETITLGAFGGVLISRFLATPLPVSLLILLIAGALVGALLERGVFRRLMASTEMEMVIATLAIAIIIRGVLRLSFGTEPFPLPLVSNQRFNVLGTNVGAQAVLVILFGMLLAALGYWIVQRTRAGLRMRVTATDADMSKALGIDVRKVVAGVWSGTFAAGFVAGGLIGPLIFARVDMGFEPLIKGLAGAILGGFGSLPGAILGPYIIALVETLASNLYSSAFRNTYAFLVIFLVLGFRPSGLFNVEVAKRV